MTLHRLLLNAFACASLAAMAAALLSCGPPTPLPAGMKPDVTLFVIDTLRNDELSWSGGDTAVAPGLSAFALGGIVFPRTYAPCSWTKPSTASILTGLHPLRHGVNGNLDKMGASAQTIAEIFHDAGYETAAVVSNRALYDDGIRQGFDQFIQIGDWIDHSSDWVGREARQQIENAPRDKPLFLYVHFLDPHDRYMPPAQDRLFLPSGYEPGDHQILNGNMRKFEGDIPVRDKTPDDFQPTPIPLGSLDLSYMRGLYRGEFHAVDREFARILDAERSWRGTNRLTVVTSDHGESFYEHGMYRHGWTLHEEVIRVPLIFNGQILEGRTFDPARIARSIDIVPTILDLTGEKSGMILDGVSLAQPPPAEGSILLGLTRYHVQKLTYLIEDPYKLIVDERFGRNELYNLQSDPGENHNLIESEQDRAREMLGRAVQLRDQYLAGKLPADLVEGKDKEELQRSLQGLGYIR